MSFRDRLIISYVLICLLGVLGSGYFVLEQALSDKRSYITELNTVLGPSIKDSLDRKSESLIVSLKELTNLLVQTTNHKNSHFEQLNQFKKKLSGVDAVMIRNLKKELRVFPIADNLQDNAQLTALIQDFGRVDSFTIAANKLTHFAGPLFLFNPKEDLIGAVLLNPDFFKDSFDLARGKISFLGALNGEILFASNGINDLNFFKNQIPLTDKLDSEVLSIELKDKNKKSYLANVVRSSQISNAYVTILSPGSSWFELAAPVLKASLSLIFVLVTFSLIFSLFLSRSLANPIEELSDAALKAGRGDWDALPVKRSVTEIRKLSLAFNRMLENLKRRDQELAAAQHKIIQAQSLAAVGRMSAGLAHEVKNPLSSVLAYAQLLEMVINNSSNKATAPNEFTKIQNYNKLIIDDTRRASKIISDLLTFSRQKEVRKEKVFLSHFNQQAEPKMAALCEAHGVQFSCHLPADLSAQCIVIDTEQLLQVVLNFVQNAIHALKSSDQTDKKISLNYFETSGYLCISVNDNGPGISKENLSKIFEPFFSTKNVGEGTGLGLSICYGIVQQHGGSIEVTSEPHIKTSFNVRLQLIKSMAA